jgi:hypothetical protein
VPLEEKLKPSNKRLTGKEQVMQNSYKAMLVLMVSLILPLILSAAEEKKVKEKKEETSKIQVVPGFADEITITGFV